MAELDEIARRLRAAVNDLQASASVGLGWPPGLMEPVTALALAPASEGRDHLIEAFLTGVLDESPRGSGLDFFRLQSEWRLRLVQLLFERGRFTYEVYAAAARYRPQDNQTWRYADAVDDPMPEIVSALEAYRDRLAWEVGQDLSDVRNRDVLAHCGPLTGTRFLLLAARHCAEHAIEALDPPATRRVGDHAAVHDCVRVLAEARPASAEEERSLPEELRSFPATALEAVLPAATHVRRQVLEALGRAEAVPLLHLVESAIPRGQAWKSRVFDAAAIRAAFDCAGEPLARRVLDLLGREQDLENGVLVARAARGWNRDEVERGVQHSRLIAIAAYGLVPLAGAESAVDRFLRLRWSAKEGRKFGMERRQSHASVVQVAMAHLAQVAGYPDATSLEWDLEARIASDLTPDGRTWPAGPYELRLVVEDADASLQVAKAGRPLRSVPAAVRSQPAYAEARAAVEQVRDQARRFRSGLLERLIATGQLVTEAELLRLLALPVARHLLQRLVFRLAGGPIGLLTLGDVLALHDLDGAAHPVRGPVGLAHPYHLFEAGVLAAWQREVVRRRIVQPVRQVFRELYLVTPVERQAGTRSRRFADHQVDGAIAARLLSSRGWSDRGDGDTTPARVFPEVRAALDLVGPRWLGDPSPATTGDVWFRPAAAPPRGWRQWREEPDDLVPLEAVPPLTFSEAMRDVDLVVSVAHRGDAGHRLSPEAMARCGELLAALVEDLGLRGVAIDGHFALVTGSLATYRVHLGSGAVHVDPGNHLCIIRDPRAAATGQPVFLPFADDGDDRMGEIVSKVLLLANDHLIRDPTILRQIPGAGRPNP